MEAHEPILQQLVNLYVSYRQRYVLCMPNNVIITPKSKATGYSKLTGNVLRGHLEHKYAVALFAGPWGSKFLCFDVDDGNKNTVFSIIRELTVLGILREKIYVSLSGGKGFHVEVFFDEIVSTQRLWNLYQHVLRNCGLNANAVEFRPTHKQAIKLPLSIHARTGNICWYVDPETLVPIHDETYILGIQQNAAGDIESALSLPELERFPLNHQSAQDRQSNGQGTASPRVNSLGVILTEEGTRHNTMRSIAVHQRIDGADEATCRKTLEEWYQKQNPDLIHSSPAMVDKDISALVRWVYSPDFQIPSRSVRKDGALISASQMRIALSQDTRTARRLTFLLLMRCRMLESQISAKDAGTVIGVSSKIIYKTLHRLISSNVILCDRGERLYLPDGIYSAKSNSYTVPHQDKQPFELQIEITMKDLMFSFDRTYYTALHTQIPQKELREVLSKQEWEEYLSWAEMIESGNCGLPQDRRIDLIGEAYEMALNERVRLTAYKIDGRMLFPAYDCALHLCLPNPSTTGSQCPHKELRHIEVPRCTLPNGKKSHQVICKNFIPAEDVLKLASRSGSANRDKITDWVASLETEVTG